MRGATLIPGWSRLNRKPRTRLRPRAARRMSVPISTRAIELIGKRWAGAIVWVLADGPHYFGELSLAVPGLSDRLLSRRLRELEKEGLVERSVHSTSPPRVSYALTEKGRALEPTLRELRSWAQHWNGYLPGHA